MGSLALRNLLHDKVRLAVTLTGIVFAVVLIVIQFGLFVGFMTTTSNNIDHAGADLWISYPGVRNFDQGHALPERKRWRRLPFPAWLKPRSTSWVSRSGSGP